MVVRTRPPQTPVMPRSVADAPRRWPRRLALAIGSIVVIAIVTGAVWLTNIEPLTRGSAGFAINDPAVHVRDVSAMGVTGSVQTIEAKPGMQFRYRFSLRNDGPAPVVITDVGTGDIAGVTSTIVAARPDLYAGAGPSRGFAPFESFTLAPGAEAGIEMLVSIPADVCIGGHGSTESWYSEPVTFTLGGVTRHADVDTGTEIRLLGSRATRC
jgi:hypothetical protein